ncbi:MAG: NAD-dependent epimerase/dehydratase family protein [Candidatus Omnitrophica bacterium]|jgi:CDP-paratose 2-epimerase|nr:NAD-dependent epimerase/dehydratase family protein [Candidatus Omnitrophota bacterium]
MTPNVLVTGSSGLVGSEAVRFFSERGFLVTGIDNDMRSSFFGPTAGTSWNKELLIKDCPGFRHIDIDIRDKPGIEAIFKKNKFNLIIHAAAQPSHDWAATDPETDFSVNAFATLLLLEVFRRYCPEAVFIFTSTNKVYGDSPNTLPFVELDTRYEIPQGHKFYQGINETMSIDMSTHSLFGVSKASADLLVQEYGRYFGLKTAVFRGGCLTGPRHSAAILHGFLAYLIQCALCGKKYIINGYKGKQVRDNIHSHDLVNAFYHFYCNPRCGEVYNIGGSRHSNISIIEAVKKIEAITGKKAVMEYCDKPRTGDHIWYISDVSKFKNHYPKWDYEYNLDETIAQMCEEMEARSGA